MLAGLEEITDGRILIGDRIVNNVAPGARDIAMVFQSYALYPHMTVYDNLAFGLRNKGFPKKEIDERVRRASAILDLDPLIKRKPKQLSGGQRQRVALGRAIVREPAAFLMDEPLSNLDAQLRVATRAEILKLQESLGTTTIYVTHDQVEAMTMGDRIAVMRLGVLQQIGTPEELYTNPTNTFVAGFIGSPAMNLIPTTALDGVGEDGQIVGFRPEHVDLGERQGERVRFDATVEVVEYLGDEQLAHLSLGDTPVQAKLSVEEKLQHGQRRPSRSRATSCASSTPRPSSGSRLRQRGASRARGRRGRRAGRPADNRRRSSRCGGRAGGSAARPRAAAPARCRARGGRPP